MVADYFIWFVTYDPKVSSCSIIDPLYIWAFIAVGNTEDTQSSESTYPKIILGT